MIVIYYLFLIPLISLCITYVSCTDDEHQATNNLKKELVNLFTIEIDKDKDGLVSFEELRDYLIDFEQRTIEYNTDRRWLEYSPEIHEVFSWEGYEPEKKEVLTWEHYFNQTYPDLAGIDVGIPLKSVQDTSRLSISSQDAPVTAPSISQSEKLKAASIESEKDPHIKALKLMVHRADARWRLADENGDTLLTRDEFKYLWHPEEGNQDMQELYIKEATEDIDLNKNSKVELDEFINHLKEMVPEQEASADWIASQKSNFDKFLDKNKDGHLDENEIKQWLLPEKSKKSEMEAKRYLDIGDKNEDMQLSQSEVAENYDTFIQLLPPDYFEENSESQYDDSVLKPRDEL